MARSIREISDIIRSAKDQRLELNELQSESRVSIFNAWIFVISTAIHSFEVIMDNFRSDINNILDRRINGTPEYYASQSLLYQDGDEIQVLDNGARIGYPNIDPSKRIITRASFEERVVSPQNNDTTLVLKVAKGEPLSLGPLSEDEQVRFRSYIDKIRFAGTRVSVVSVNGDILIPKLTVYYDGVVQESEVREAVNSTITSFMTNLNFDSVFFKSALIEAILDVENVIDVYEDPSAVETQGVFIRNYDDNNQLQDEQEVLRTYTTVSGYLKESSKQGDEVSVPDFSDSIIYTVETQL